MRIAMLYGEFSTRQPFDVTKLYTERGLTGSETSFFNLARTLAERGHEVATFSPCVGPQEHSSGFTSLPLSTLPALKQQQNIDAVLCWNEPDYLVHAPESALRVMNQQLNDFAYIKTPNWHDLIDVFVSPSQHHLNFLMTRGAPNKRPMAIPNSIDLDLLPQSPPQRNPHRVVYCSSPDRGLHHLLSMWPSVRATIPDAELKIFYRIKPWIDQFRDAPPNIGYNAMARRSRYIEEALERLDGFGVEVVGPVPNVRMMHELASAKVLVYPCDTIVYTEGFGCSVLDAAASGCVPLISSCDALPSVHGRSAVVIDGPPAEEREKWLDMTLHILRQDIPQVAQNAMRAHAEAHSRQLITDMWERLLSSGK